LPREKSASVAAVFETGTDPSLPRFFDAARGKAKSAPDRQNLGNGSCVCKNL